MKRNIVFGLVLTLFATFFLAGCYEPSPLYGKWQSSELDTISFTSDGSFTATFIDRYDPTEKIQYSGTWSTIDNVLNISTNSKSFLTEWDIRGAILYINWPFDEGLQTIKFYHVSK